MPVVLESMPFGATGRQGQDGIETIQGLDRRFLVYTEDGSMLWWM
jgi:hypothetical protein